MSLTLGAGPLTIEQVAEVAVNNTPVVLSDAAKAHMARSRERLEALLVSGESIYGVLTNQANAPKGISDSDAYSHFAFVRTLQDMFGLADPKSDASYMNRSKYSERFIAQNIVNLPEFANSKDTHFDSVRPMNHAYVIPAGYVQKQSTDDKNDTAQVGPDSSQANAWALKK